MAVGGGADEGAGVKVPSGDYAVERGADLGIGGEHLDSLQPGAGQAEGGAGLGDVRLRFEHLRGGGGRLSAGRLDGRVPRAFRGLRRLELLLLFVHEFAVNGPPGVEVLDALELFLAEGAPGGQPGDVGLGLSHRGVGRQSIRLGGRDPRNGLAALRLGLLDRRVRRVDGSLKLRGVDLGQRLSSTDRRTDVHTLRLEEPGRLGVEIDRLEGMDGPGLNRQPPDAPLDRLDHVDVQCRSLVGRGREGASAGPLPARFSPDDRPHEPGDGGQTEGRGQYSPRLELDSPSNAAGFGLFARRGSLLGWD